MTTPGPGTARTRNCTVCRSPNRSDVDEGLAAGQSARALAARYGLGRDAIGRHAARCVVEAVAAARVERDQVAGASTQARVEALAQRAGDLLAAAEARALGPDASARDFTAAAAALRELRSTVELLAKLSGELSSVAFQVGVVVAQAPTRHDHDRQRELVAEALAADVVAGWLPPGVLIRAVRGLVASVRVDAADVPEPEPS